MTPLLELRGVSRHFGGLQALSDVTIEIGHGEIVGLIGPNGAGKTTLINVVTGVHRVTRGTIFFAGHRIDGLRAHHIARIGVARTFQLVQPFPRMTVIENVMAGALFGGGLRTFKAARERALEHLTLVGLAEMADAPATALTLANRKRLELAKSLAMNPRLLLLDEVNAGLNATEIGQALSLIRRLAERGITLLIVEHLMKVVMAVCSRVIVLHHGELIGTGSPAEIVRDRKVVEAYLGARWASKHQAALT